MRERKTRRGRRRKGREIGREGVVGRSRSESSSKECIHIVPIRSVHVWKETVTHKYPARVLCLTK